MAEQTITIHNVRQESAVQMHAKLKDNGVALDWTSLSDVKAYMYSDAQRVIAGKCTVEINAEDSEVLDVLYPATAPQYLGHYSLLVRCTYQGREKTFDVPVVNFVERTAQATGVTVITDPEIDVELEVEDVSTSLLDGAIAAALDAAVRAEEAAAVSEADHLVAVADHEAAESDHTRAGTDHTRAESDHTTAAADHTQAGTDHTAAVAATAAANDAATLATTKAGLVQDKLDRADTDHTRAESDHTTAVSDHGTAGTDHTTAASDHSTAANDHTIAGNDHTQAASDHGTAAADHTLAASDHTTAAGDHDTAGDDHAQAVADHGTASTDHGTAVADHTQAASDHTTAAADHTQAGNDHSTAAADHTTAGTDHTTAAADHTQAGNDHTQAGTDHGVAADDHTQAVADHAVMAGYDTRLGAVETKTSQLDQKVGNQSSVTTRHTVATSADFANTGKAIVADESNTNFGKSTSASTRSATNYVDVREYAGKIMTYTRVKVIAASSAYGLVFFTEAAQAGAISPGYLFETGAAEAGYEVVEVTIPSNAVYARFTFATSDLEHFQAYVEETVEGPYTSGLGKDVQDLQDEVAVLDGLKWVDRDTVPANTVTSVTASYTVNLRSLDVTIDTVSVFDKKAGEWKTFYADGDASLHQPATFHMGVNPGQRNLVIAGDGTFKLRDNAAAVAATDLLLLRYDTNIYAVVGGALYADFAFKVLSRKAESLSERVDVLEAAEKSVIPANIGQVNCVRKALQMARIKWTPKSSIPNNSGTFTANVEQTGMVYSSVKEFSQFAFIDVSLETFMTAVNNPRSVLYTENVSAGNSRSALGRTYHGTNCACYYGSVCSSLLAFAYGLRTNMTTAEFRNWDRMEVLEDQTPYGLTIGDAIWESGHIQMVIGITKDVYGVITNIRIAESSGTLVHIENWTVAYFQTYMMQHSCVLMRYKDLYLNRDYVPLTDFVAVQDEVLGSYDYNDDICPNYGEKANYAEGDDVVLNLRSDYASEGFTTLEVYKGDTKVIDRAIADEDETLTGLEYGAYKARIVGSGAESEYVHFIVVNMSVVKSGSGFTFGSENATPVYYEFDNEAGSRNGDIVGKSTHTFTSEELTAGAATPVSPIVADETHPYLKVHFETDYGRVIKVIDWNS